MMSYCHSTLSLIPGASHLHIIPKTTVLGAWGGGRRALKTQELSLVFFVSRPDKEDTF